VSVAKRSKKKKKETLHWQTGYSPDHPRRRIEILFVMVGGLSAMVISFKFHQDRLSGYRAVMGQNLADLITKANGLTVILLHKRVALNNCIGS